MAVDVDVTYAVVSFLPAKHQRFVTLATTIKATTTRTNNEMIVMAMMETMPSPEPKKETEKI